MIEVREVALQVNEPSVLNLLYEGLPRVSGQCCPSVSVCIESSPL